MPKLARLVPHYVEVVTIYAHDDENGTGQRYAYALARILDERGIEVRVEGLGPMAPLPDVNETLRPEGPDAVPGVGTIGRQNRARTEGH